MIRTDNKCSINDDSFLMVVKRSMIRTMNTKIPMWHLFLMVVECSTIRTSYDQSGYVGYS